MAMMFNPCGCCSSGIGSGCSTGVKCFRLYDPINIKYPTISCSVDSVPPTTCSPGGGSYCCFNSAVSAIGGYTITPLTACSGNLTHSFSIGNVPTGCNTYSNTINYCCTCFNITEPTSPYLNAGQTHDAILYTYSSGFCNLVFQFGPPTAIPVGATGYYRCDNYSTNAVPNTGLVNITTLLYAGDFACVPNGSGGGTSYKSNCRESPITWCDSAVNTLNIDWSSTQTCDIFLGLDCAYESLNCGPCSSSLTTKGSGRLSTCVAPTLNFAIEANTSGFFGTKSGTTVALNFNTSYFYNQVSGARSTCSQTGVLACNDYYAQFLWESSCQSFSSTISMKIYYLVTRNDSWLNPFYTCFPARTYKTQLYALYYHNTACSSDGSFINQLDFSWAYASGSLCSPAYLSYPGIGIITE